MQIPTFKEVADPERIFTFCKITEREGKADFGHLSTIRFLHDNGFRTNSSNSTQFLRVVDNVISDTSRDAIKQFVMDTLDQLPDIVKENGRGNEITKDDFIELMLTKSNVYLSQERLSHLKPLKKQTARDTKSEARVYYHNKVVLVTKDGIKEVDYKDLPEPIWDKQITKRHYVHRPFIEGEAVFSKFCSLICNNDKLRLDALKTKLGYLLHTFKDPTKPIIIVFTDEMYSGYGEANGGVGKSLLVTALTYMRPVVLIDGRTLNLKDKRANQSLQPFHAIRWIEDIGKGFNFDDIVQEATGITQVKREFENVISMSYAESPKTVITGNYLPLGSGGNTESRRKEIQEIFPYFNKSHEPEDEFGHTLFDEWDTEEWSKFDAFMLECVRLHLATGLIHSPLLNVLKKTIIQKTDEDFYYWFDAKIRKEDKEFEKEKLMHEFKQLYPEHKSMKKKQFTSWIFQYLRNSNIAYREESVGSITRERIVIL